MRLWNNRTKPIQLHMAIVQDRDNNNSDLDRRQNFFRDTTSTTARAHPFSDYVALDPWDGRMMANPINSDHYNVITHLKINMDGAFSDVNNQRPHYKTTSKYFKINRRIAFDNVTDTTNWRPFYVCFWWLFINPDDQPGTATAGVAYTYKTEVVYKHLN